MVLLRVLCFGMCSSRGVLGCGQARFHCRDRPRLLGVVGTQLRMAIEKAVSAFDVALRARSADRRTPSSRVEERAGMVGIVTRSALVVVVAEAEPPVSAHRMLHDPMAARGVPAHVTILHPFRTVVDEVTAHDVVAIAGRIEAFDASFATVGRFPGAVLFLSPEPVDRFKQMTRIFVDAFPRSDRVLNAVGRGGIDPTADGQMRVRIREHSPVPRAVRRPTTDDPSEPAHVAGRGRRRPMDRGTVRGRSPL
jgi:hypothetical protein